jgi:hypothetical protein
MSLVPGSKQEFKEYSGDNVIFLGGSFNHSGFYMRIIKDNEDWSVSANNADFKEMKIGEYVDAGRFVMGGAPFTKFQWM